MLCHDLLQGYAPLVSFTRFSIDIFIYIYGLSDIRILAYSSRAIVLDSLLVILNRDHSIIYPALKPAFDVYNLMDFIK